MRLKTDNLKILALLVLVILIITKVFNLGRNNTSINKKIELRGISLNPRQERILKLLNSKREITNSDIQSVVNHVTDRTLRRDLRKLEMEGFIKRKGKTKGTMFVKV